MRRTFVDALEHALRPRHPPVRRGHVAVDRRVQERQPARQLGGLRAQAAPFVFDKRPLLQLDRAPSARPGEPELGFALGEQARLQRDPRRPRDGAPATVDLPVSA